MLMLISTFHSKPRAEHDAYIDIDTPICTDVDVADRIAILAE